MVDREYLEFVFTEYGKTLENELSTLEDEDVRHILVSLLNVDRSSATKKADKMAARERATQLFNDGDILSLLCQPLGRNQLRETFAAFLALHRVNIAQFIQDRCSTLSQQARDTLKDCGKWQFLGIGTRAIGQCKTQTSDCKLQTGVKMLTEGKTQMLARGKVQTADYRRF